MNNEVRKGFLETVDALADQQTTSLEGTKSGRQKMIDNAWKVFIEEIKGQLQKSETKPTDDVVNIALKQVETNLRKEAMSAEWLIGDKGEIIPYLEPAVRKKHLQFKMNLFDPTISLGRLALTQLIGGLLGLMIFPPFFWFAHLPTETLLLLSIPLGSVLLSCAVVSVNNKWATIIKFLKEKSKALGIAALVSLFILVFIRPGSLGGLRSAWTAIRQRIQFKTPSLFQRPRNRFGTLWLLVPLLILIVILGRPSSRKLAKEKEIEDQFKLTVRQWLDYVTVLAAGIKFQTSISKHIEETLKVKDFKKRLNTIAYNLRIAKTLEEFHTERQRLHSLLGYTVDMANEDFPHDVQVYSKNPPVIIWEEQCKKYWDPICTIRVGERAMILKAYLMESNGIISELGKAGLYNEG